VSTAIVTGATGGLGLECARSLVGRGWDVVLAVRDVERGRAVAAELGRCTVEELDLSSLASVRAFAAREPRATTLVCNAGVQVVSGTRWSTDGIELTFAVNHLGHFALATALAPRLESVVMVSSDTHDPARSTGMPAPLFTSVDELAYGDLPGRTRYTTSKLCNILFAYELERRIEGLRVNAFNPGLMPGSGLARDYPPLQRFAWRFVLPVMRVLPQVRSTRSSGRDLAALAADHAVSGRYFDGRREIRSSEQSYDETLARELWEGSERLIST
jgi:NAD(P)-dependent dehydrogenase (short-subunit alcohol dehydrogenase family)